MRLKTLKVGLGDYFLRVQGKWSAHVGRKSFPKLFQKSYYMCHQIIYLLYGSFFLIRPNFAYNKHS